MKRILLPIILAAALSGASCARADEDVDLEEVIVTGSRISDWEPDIVPSVRLIKRADFMIQRIQVINDSRKEEMREKEIYSTIKALLDAAQKSKTFALGTGEDIFVPLTEENYMLSLTESEGKADTSYTYLLVKAPLDAKSKANKIAEEIRAFIKKAKLVGRTEVEAKGDLGLSIVHPERYRQDVIKLIADDVKMSLAAFGDGYKVEIQGLEWPLLWERQGLATMSLYIPYKYDIVPIRN